MNDKELINYIKKVNPSFDSHIEKGTIEMSNEYYNLCEELMARGINAIEQKEELQEKANKYDKLFSDWNQLEEWLKEEIKRLDNYMMSLNYSPQGDLPITYYRAEYKKQAKDKVLSKMQEIQRSDSDE